ncbi:DUF2141 domain-containing protein [Sphingomonas sp. G-3-2-10]|uniref:DUF2141 domain-containing protein n=1 Tax=Sphingomonas sp. G-3-2-10 TaxID=2728838 RepID=UPI00146C849E|nr:DUF2141 domain-containing protein [Sphingomonas sp. G-3-2-10]NML06691.1 DUF2141 domain-containing protein [Sphingomonas sp. G-3-2-10]
MIRPLMAALAAPALILTAMPVAAIARPAPDAQAAAATLTLHFEGIREAKGAVMIAIYKDEASWNGGAPVRVAMLQVAQGNEVKVEGLAPGRYAVKVFHDADGDGKLTMNPFGIPIEPFGFSRDAVGDRGSPAWDAAAFEIGAGASVQIITLR